MLAFWFTLLAVLTVLLVGSCAVMLVPTIVLRPFGHAILSLAAALATTAGLAIDTFYNWDGITYPHWILGIPTAMFLFTFPAGLIGIGLGIMAVIDQAAGDGMADAELAARLPRPEG